MVIILWWEAVSNRRCAIITGMRKLYSFKQDLKESLKDPQFYKAWKKSEPEYLLTCKELNERLNKNKCIIALYGNK